MNKSTGPKTSESKKENRGIALVTILAVLSLAAVLIMAFFSLTRNELTSSTQYSHGLEAQQLSQTAINIVMHQIRNATDSAGVAWASQPGMIRTWTPSEKKGYKLYSDDEMVITLGGIIMLPTLLAMSNPGEPVTAVLLMAVILFGFQTAIGNVQTLPSDFFGGKTVGTLAGLSGMAAKF